MSTSCSFSLQQQEVKKILHDLIYTQAFFLNTLSKALHNNYIRGLQWSFDGRCVCVNKAAATIEFEHYLNLTQSSGKNLECYSRLISRLLDHNFQLATSCYRLPRQVTCYFLPSFHKSSFYVNFQLLTPDGTFPYFGNSPQSFLHQSSFFVPQQQLLYLSDERITNGRLLESFMPIGQTNFVSSVSNRFPSFPGTNFQISHGTSFHQQRPNFDRFCVKAVPLSFFHTDDQSETSACEHTDYTTISNSSSSEELSDDEDKCEDNSTIFQNQDTLVGKHNNKILKQVSITPLQRKIFDLFFNPRQKRRSSFLSWLNGYYTSRGKTNAGNAWNSAILMSRGGKKKSKCFKSPIRENFALQNSHLVDVFGNAYISWKESKNRADEKLKIANRSSGLLRFNFSSLYDKDTASDILESSRSDKQIQAAIESILN